MLVSEELTRQTAQLESLASKVEDHGERLVRMETILSFFRSTEPHCASRELKGKKMGTATNRGPLFTLRTKP